MQKIADQKAFVEGLLRQTEKAHAEFEHVVLAGNHDADWPKWYADYMVGALESEHIELANEAETRVKVEGEAENNRNAQNRQLYTDIIREVYGVQDVIIGHHLVYQLVENRDGFDFQVIEEIPSADTLIFDHDAAQKLWGEAWPDILKELAIVPVPERDEVLHRLYYGRGRIVS